jgi:DNA repair ATPase RecN
MLNKLKDDILRLLKEDEEFRYAVIGLLGLQRLEEAIARLIDIQANMEARLSKVEEAIVRLTDSHIELRNVVASIKVDIKDLRSEMKKVSDKYGLTLEDLAVSKLPLSYKKRV